MAKNGLVFITKATFTTSAAVNINNCFSATYTHYIIKRNLLGSGTDPDLNVRLRVGGVDASGADYRMQRLYADSTTVGASRSTAGTSMTLALGYGELTSFGYVELWISNPFEAVRTTAWNDHSYDQDNSNTLYSRVHAHDLTTSYDGFSVIPSTGTITGSISVFGLVKS